MRSAAPPPRMAEAAQANRGGLECSSYTWQVRPRVYDAFGPDCQGHPVSTRHPPHVAFEAKYHIYNVLTRFTPTERAVIDPGNGGE